MDVEEYDALTAENNIDLIGSLMQEEAKLLEMVCIECTTVIVDFEGFDAVTAENKIYLISSLMREEAKLQETVYIMYDHNGRFEGFDAITAGNKIDLIGSLMVEEGLIFFIFLHKIFYSTHGNCLSKMISMIISIQKI